MDKNNSPPAVPAAGSGVGAIGQREASATAPAKQAKWMRVLGGFLERGPLGWNRFEAARELRDHVLPTTVSQLEKRGLKILRQEETVLGHFGPVRCARYWLPSESLDRARELLGLPASTP